MTARGLVVALVLASAPAFAQTADVDALLREGVQQRQEGRDEDALATFRRAWARSPEARVRAQIALAEQALGRWADAWRDLRATLRSADDPWVREHRGPLEESLAAVTARVALLRVEGDAAGAEVLVDGAVVATLPMREPVALAPGAVTLSVRAAGHATVTRAVRAEAGETRVEHVELPPPPARPPGAVTVRRGGAQRAVGWTLLAVGAVGAGVGVAGLALREEAVRSYNTDPACPGALAGAQPPLCQARIDDGDTARLLQVVGFVVGGAAAVAAVVLLVTAPSSAGARERAARVGCGRGPGDVGVACAATF